jgi:hypothetical protein
MPARLAALGRVKHVLSRIEPSRAGRRGGPCIGGRKDRSRARSGKVVSLGPVLSRNHRKPTAAQNTRGALSLDRWPRFAARYVDFPERAPGGARKECQLTKVLERARLSTCI